MSEMPEERRGGVYSLHDAQQDAAELMKPHISSPHKGYWASFALNPLAAFLYAAAWSSKRGMPWLMEAIASWQPDDDDSVDGPSWLIVQAHLAAEEHASMAACVRAVVDSAPPIRDSVRLMMIDAIMFAESDFDLYARLAHLRQRVVGQHDSERSHSDEQH